MNKSVLRTFLACMVVVQWALASSAMAQSSHDEAATLRKRFRAAVYAAVRPTDDGHFNSLIEVLRNIEQDFTVSFSTNDLIESYGEDFAHLRADKPSPGIRSFKPLERYANRESSDFMMEAIAYTSICLPSEEEYNLRYIDYLERQKWSTGKFASEPLRYALYARMLQRKCIGKADFKKRTEKLAGVLLNSLKKRGLEAGEAASYMYLLSSSHRFAEIPGPLMKRFVESQHATGSWEGGQAGDPAVSAAQGAYVLAELLRRSGTPITNLDIFEAWGELAPIPTTIPFKK